MATLQAVIKARLLDTPALMADEPTGLGFQGVYAKWLTPKGAGSEPNAYNINGVIKPAIVVLAGSESTHPSPSTPGWRKWDQFPLLYLFHYPGDHGKDVLDQAKLAAETALCDRAWRPAITGGQLPVFLPETADFIDDPEQFPGNVVLLMRFRVSGLRAF